MTRAEVVKCDVVYMLCNIALQMNLIKQPVYDEDGLCRDDMHPIMYDVAVAIASAHAQEGEERKRHVAAIYAPYGFIMRLNDSVDDVHHLIRVFENTITHVKHMSASA